jgi:hypothetical protein
VQDLLRRAICRLTTFYRAPDLRIPELSSSHRVEAWTTTARSTWQFLDDRMALASVGQIANRSSRPSQGRLRHDRLASWSILSCKPSGLRNRAGRSTLEAAARCSSASQVNHASPRCPGGSSVNALMMKLPTCVVRFRARVELRRPFQCQRWTSKWFGGRPLVERWLDVALRSSIRRKTINRALIDATKQRAKQRPYDPKARPSPCAK